MGILAFGLSTPKSLAIACGVIVSAWGPTEIALYLWVSDHMLHTILTNLSFDQIPGYFDKKEKYQP